MHKINSILVSTTSTESKACKHMNHSSSSIAHFCHAHIVIFSLMVLDGFLNASAPGIPQCLKTFAPIQQVSQFSQFTRGFIFFSRYHQQIFFWYFSDDFLRASPIQRGNKLIQRSMLPDVLQDHAHNIKKLLQLLHRGSVFQLLQTDSASKANDKILETYKQVPHNLWHKQIHRATVLGNNNNFSL